MHSTQIGNIEIVDIDLCMTVTKKCVKSIKQKPGGHLYYLVNYFSITSIFRSLSIKKLRLLDLSSQGF